MNRSEAIVHNNGKDGPLLPRATALLVVSVWSNPFNKLKIETILRTKLYTQYEKSRCDSLSLTVWEWSFQFSVYLIFTRKKLRIHRSASLVVMQIYQCSKVSSLFSRVNKLSRKLVCKVDVIATASPLPSLVGYAFVSVITPASRKFAITTSSRNGVRNTSGCNRVGESCFSAS